MPDLTDDLPLDDLDTELPLDDDIDEELPLDEGGDERERIVPLDEVPARGLTPEQDRIVAETIRDLESVTPIVEILPLGFPLPRLIKFIPNPEHKRALDVAVAYAIGIDVKGSEQLILADTALGSVRDRMAVIVNDFAEPAQLADQLHKGITSTRAAWLREAEAVVKTVGTRIATETKRLNDLAAEARRKEQAAADAKAREEAAARVAAAQQQQAPKEVVEVLEQQARTARAEPVQSAAGSASASVKLVHSTVATTWKARFVGTALAGDEDPHPKLEEWTDLHRKGMLQLCKAVLDGKAPLKAVLPNWSYLDDRAGSDTTTLSIGGIEAFQVSSTRAKPRRK